jgi:hypothetical protein
MFIEYYNHLFKGFIKFERNYLYYYLHFKIHLDLLETIKFIKVDCYFNFHFKFNF